MTAALQAKPNVVRMPSHLGRLVAVIVGCLCLALGVIGAILPLLPSTPFFLCAVGCFAKASPRLEAKLMSIDFIASPVRAWRQRGAIALPAKIAATICMGLSLAYLALSGVSALALGAAAGLVMLCAIFIWTRPA